MKALQYVISAVLSVVLALAVSEFVTRAPVSASVGVPMFAASRGFGGGGNSTATSGGIDYDVDGTEEVASDGTTVDIDADDNAGAEVAFGASVATVEADYSIGMAGDNIQYRGTGLIFDTGSLDRLTITDTIHTVKNQFDGDFARDGTVDLTITEDSTVADGVLFSTPGQINLDGVMAFDDSTNSWLVSHVAARSTIANDTHSVTLDTAGNVEISGETGVAFDGDDDGTWDAGVEGNGIFFIGSGAAPPATCDFNLGSGSGVPIFLDTDETDDTNCTTTADNSFCLCLADNTWTAFENN